MGIIVGLIGLLIGGLMLSMNLNKKQKQKEAIEKSKKCSAALYIEDQPFLQFKHFKSDEIKQIQFQLLRDNNSIKDTIISSSENSFRSIEVPFNKFLKSDTVLITINNNLNYSLSDFKYKTGLLYGMFGPVAISDCVIYSSTINNNNSLELNKLYAKLNSEKKDLPLRISNKNSSYTEFIKNYTITEDKLENIKKNIRKKYSYQHYGLNSGIEINKNSSYYICLFYRNYGDNKEFVVVKVDTETGEFTKPIKNYPIENDY